MFADNLFILYATVYQIKERRNFFKAWLCCDRDSICANVFIIAISFVFRIFITGGAGFIGSRLTKLFLQHGHQVTIYDTRSYDDFSAQHKTLASQIRREDYIQGSILDYNYLLSELQKSESSKFVHLAANTGVPSSITNPENDLEVNVLGTFNCLRASSLAGINRFIFASSGAPTGNSEPPITEESLTRPLSPYGASKLSGEAYCSAFYNSFGLDTVVLRFSNVYGPGSSLKTSVIPKYIRAALAREQRIVYGDGMSTRDFLYVDDLAEAVIAICNKDSGSGEIFQIGTGKETTLLELNDLLAQALIHSGLEDHGFVTRDFRKGDITRNYCDPSRVRARFGWESQTQLLEGLGRTVKYFNDL